MFYRKLYDKLVKHLAQKEFSIITGPRQTGKSTLIRQVEEHCRQEGIPTLFLNLENRAFLTELSSHPLNVLKYLPDSDKKTVVFIDEVQYHPDPSNLLKLLYDEHADKIKVVATGSSAFYLDQRFRDSLAGRKKIFHLLTCSFDEYLELSGKPELLQEKERLTRNRDAKSAKMGYLRIEWENYMIFGGYPAVITEPDKQEKVERLNEIRDAFVKRDIQESGVANENAFYQLFRILAAQTGKLVNVNELANTLRVKNDTVHNYLSVMHKCFHIGLVRPFYRNNRKELVKMPKLHLLDNGMRNCLLNNFQPLNFRTDKGELWENTMYKLLVEKYGMDMVQFWRTSAGNEVDFVLPHIQEPKAIEVKFDESSVNPNKYKIFSESYPEIPLDFAWMVPFDEVFFHRTENL